ncbi:Hypothetical predicted protein, partial [Paramuricea clavata]
DDGNNFINDTSENCLQPQNRENFDSNRNNHGKQIINICKNTDMRILNGRTKEDSLGRPTFHGRKGTSVVDYIICDQNTFQNAKYFAVKPPSTYLSDHSKIIAWIDIQKTINIDKNNYPQPPLHKLPLQFKWSQNSNTSFRQTLKSPEIQQN